MKVVEHPKGKHRSRQDLRNSSSNVQLTPNRPLANYAIYMLKRRAISKLFMPEIIYM